LGIWDRLVSRDSSPNAEWLTLPADQVRFEGSVGGVRVWRFADGDAVGLYFFPLVPDLPQARSPEDFRAAYAEKVSAAGVTLVEFELVDLAGFRSLRSIVKVPQSLSGMTYVGSVTIPFATCSYVLKVQCEERGITGVREALLLDTKLREGGTPEAALEDISRSADAPKHDALFPDHPVARARKHLVFLASALRADQRLRRVEAFGLP
jgi:hypothetical protein